VWLGRVAEIPLVDFNLTIAPISLPSEVRRFLREAERRIERFQLECHTPGFVPCDFDCAYATLHALSETDATPGKLFCEWGSGIGVVSCLAAMLDFDAIGIEIDRDLVNEAQQLASDFALPVEFVHGSFIPEGSRVQLDEGGFAWLATDGQDAYAQMDLGPDDFNLIFSYPWPDEAQTIAELFERHAMPGAVLATYHGDQNLRLRRNEAGQSRPRGGRFGDKFA
jgi:hypothetical protein